MSREVYSIFLYSWRWPVKLKWRWDKLKSHLSPIISLHQLCIRVKTCYSLFLVTIALCHFSQSPSVAFLTSHQTGLLPKLALIHSRTTRLVIFIGLLNVPPALFQKIPPYACVYVAICKFCCSKRGWLLTCYSGECNTVIYLNLKDGFGTGNVSIQKMFFNYF